MSENEQVLLYKRAILGNSTLGNTQLIAEEISYKPVNFWYSCTSMAM